jgi:phosphonate metabolism protein/1,5-bisphosphokinase (PRPP-forming) PhnN
MVEGRLFYVIGPSGSGKDSLMRYGRQRLAGDPRVVFAHRYITRPVDLHGENHVALTEDEFDARLAAGLFAMHWESHGLRYGIGREINLWLAKGCNVVMNGSRAYLPEARRHYPALTAVLVTVSPEVLAARLRARGRETEDQVSQRITRARRFMSLDGNCSGSP